MVNFGHPSPCSYFRLVLDNVDNGHCYISVSAQCCNPASSSQCRAVCKAIFIEDALPSRSQREAVVEYCDQHVASCVHNYTKTTPSRNPVESKLMALVFQILSIF